MAVKTPAAKQPAKRKPGKTREPCRCVTWETDMAAASLLEPWGSDPRYARCRLCNAAYPVSARKLRAVRHRAAPPLPTQVDLFAPSEMPPVKPPKPRKIGPRKAKTASQRKTA